MDDTLLRGQFSSILQSGTNHGLPTCDVTASTLEEEQLVKRTTPVYSDTPIVFTEGLDRGLNATLLRQARLAVELADLHITK